MTRKCKKIISLLLTFVLVASVLAVAPISASATSRASLVYAIIDDFGWENYNNIYCHIYSEDGTGTYPEWQTKAELCSVDDLGFVVYDIQTAVDAGYTDLADITKDSDLYLVFSSDNGDQTTPLVFNAGYFCYTAVYDYEAENTTAPSDGKKLTPVIWDSHIDDLGYVYADLISFGWSDYNNIYCHIYSENGTGKFTEWQSKAELCEISGGYAVFDIDEALNAGYDGLNFIKENEEYYIIFSSDNGDQTSPMLFTSDNLYDILIFDIYADITTAPSDGKKETPVIWESDRLKYSLVYANIDSFGWTDYNNIYCHFYSEDGSGTYPQWQSKAESCAVDEYGIATYSFYTAISKGYTDLKNITSGSKLYIVFSSDNGDETLPIEFNATRYYDTLIPDPTADSLTAPSDGKKITPVLWESDWYYDGCVSADIQSLGWTDYKTIYCHIYADDETTVTTAWQSKTERCAVDEDGIATYSLNSAIKEGYTYLEDVSNATNLYIIFSSDNGDQTTPLRFNSSNLFDRVIYDEFADETTAPSDGKKVTPAMWDSDFGSGDVNDDGVVDINDVTAIQKHLAEISTLTKKQCVLADFNCDGEITIDDATSIQIFLANPEPI